MCLLFFRKSEEDKNRNLLRLKKAAADQADQALIIALNLKAEADQALADAENLKAKNLKVREELSENHEAKMETSKNANFLGNKINSNFLCYLHSFE
jgi:hypothetical protein